MTVQPTAAPDGATLAEVERQRLEQIELGVEAMAAFLALWATYEAAAAAGNLARWFDAIADVGTEYAAAAWELGRLHYLDLRRLAGVPGPEPELRPIDLDIPRLWGSMRSVVVDTQRDAVRRGLDPGQAADRARVRGAQAFQRHVLAPGREIVHKAVDQAADLRPEPEEPTQRPPGLRDPDAPAPTLPERPLPRPSEIDRLLVGYYRTTDGDPCFWCAMLASRGAVYATPRSAIYRADGQKYHDGCGCRAVAVWTTDPTLPAINEEMAELWYRAQFDPPPGERLEMQKPRPGSDAYADVAGRRARNNFRRLLAQRSRDLRAS